MTPLPWIQLAVTLLTPLVVLAVAWGRLAERDRARTETDARILSAIDGIRTRIDGAAERLGSHDTSITVHGSRLDALTAQLTAMSGRLDAHITESREARHALRGELQQQLATLTGEVQKRRGSR